MRASDPVALFVGLFMLLLSGVAHAASFTPLGDLPGGAFTSFALALSDDGSTVVGGSVVSGIDGAGTTEAFRWDATNGLQALPTLPGGSGGIGLDVSADGSVVVGEASSLGGGQAFRWSASEGIQALGELTGGAFFSRAGGVSGDGSTIVGDSAATSGSEAFLWDSASGLQSLASQPGGGFFQGRESDLGRWLNTRWVR